MAERGIRHIRLDGSLRRGESSIAVQIAYASRFSLYANLVEPSVLPFHQEFDHVVVRASQGEMTFGRCVFKPADDATGYTGRLVFSDDAYNFSSFFQNEDHSNLESRNHKLALVLSQDKQIKPVFRNFITDLLYELNAHKSFFDSLDSDLEDEPTEVLEMVQKSIIAREGPKLVHLFNKGLETLAHHVKSLTRDEKVAHGSYLRKQLWHIILESPFLARTNIRPRGYAGDSEMMRMIYDNTYEGDSLFGKILHKHPLDTSAAQAVRNRRTLTASLLRDFAKGFTGKKPLRLMSVACGPASEIHDIFASHDDVQAFDMTLLDQDVEALSEAARAISQVEMRHKTRVRGTYLNESVRTMLRSPQICDAWGRFDFIYSMGLFDYLTEPVARVVGQKLFDMLNPGGVLIIGNYHVDNPTRLYMEYWMDWVLCYRTESEMLGLLEELPGARCTVDFEGSGSQMFLKVEKLR